MTTPSSTCILVSSECCIVIQTCLYYAEAWACKKISSLVWLWWPFLSVFSPNIVRWNLGPNFYSSWDLLTAEKSNALKLTMTNNKIVVVHTIFCVIIFGFGRSCTLKCWKMLKNWHETWKVLDVQKSTPLPLPHPPGGVASALYSSVKSLVYENNCQCW